MLDHFYDKRLPCRHVNGVDATEKKTQEDKMPDLYITTEDEKGEERSLECRQGLRDEEDIAAVHPVGENSCKGSKKKDGDLPGKAYETK